MLVNYEKGTAKNEEVEKELVTRDEILVKVKKELAKAQQRMRKYYDEGRRMVSFEVGDYVYLKLQPFGQRTLRKKLNLKLAKKYYGPFKVLERLGEVAYRLELPPSSKLHPVFHVTVLKKRIGDPSLIVDELPRFDDEGRMLLQPREALNYRVVSRGTMRKSVWQVLIRWGKAPKEEATWEDYDDIRARFPQFILEGKDILKERGIVRPPRRVASRRAAQTLTMVGTSTVVNPQPCLHSMRASEASKHTAARAAQASAHKHAAQASARRRAAQARAHMRAAPGAPAGRTPRHFAVRRPVRTPVGRRALHTPMRHTDQPVRARAHTTRLTMPHTRTALGPPAAHASTPTPILQHTSEASGTPHGVPSSARLQPVPCGAGQWHAIQACHPAHGSSPCHAANGHGTPVGHAEPTFSHAANAQANHMGHAEPTLSHGPTNQHATT